MLLGTDAVEPAAAFFRSGSNEEWVSKAMPFYELLNPDSIRPDGKKRSFITWRNYRAYTAVMPPSVTAPRPAATPPSGPAKPPSEPKFTPAPARPKAPPPPPSRAPPPPPEDHGELKFLTAAEEMHTPHPPPPPPRRHTPPPRAAPVPEPEPEMEEETEPEAAPDAPAYGEAVADPVWPEEFERGDAVEQEEPE